jgi:multisubunit Na+/H+ antiporter MnhF subunit
LRADFGNLATLVFCCIGVYTVNNAAIDVLLILVILAPMLEENFRRR